MAVGAGRLNHHTRRLRLRLLLGKIQDDPRCDSGGDVWTSDYHHFGAATRDKAPEWCPGLFLRRLDLLRYRRRLLQGQHLAHDRRAGRSSAAPRYHQGPQVWRARNRRPQCHFYRHLYALLHVRQRRLSGRPDLYGYVLCAFNS